MDPQPMSTAPKDGTHILVCARWDWGGYGYSKEPVPYGWDVAAWGDCCEPEGFEIEGFWTVTDNPYQDLAIDPIAWAKLPAIPTQETSE